MKRYIKQPYIAFNQDEATLLFSRKLSLAQEQLPLSYISKLVSRLYSPKKSLITFIVSLILIFSIKLLPSEIVNQTWFTVVLTVVIVVMLFSFTFFIARSIGLLLEKRRLSSLYRRVQWPVEYAYHFYEEGVVINAVDMEGVFYWDDFLEIILTFDALIFVFCPPGSPKGRMLKAYYPKLHNVYFFVRPDQEMQMLIELVGAEYKNVVIK